MNWVNDRPMAPWVPNYLCCNCKDPSLLCKKCKALGARNARGDRVRNRSEGLEIPTLITNFATPPAPPVGLEIPPCVATERQPSDVYSGIGLEMPGLVSNFAAEREAQQSESTGRRERAQAPYAGDGLEAPALIGLIANCKCDEVAANEDDEDEGDDEERTTRQNRRRLSTNARGEGLEIPPCIF